MSSLEINNIYPILPLRNTVIFPNVFTPLFVGREMSIRAIEEVVGDDPKILLVTQKNAAVDNPGPADLYDIGTVASIEHFMKLPDGTLKLMVEGVGRAKIADYLDTETYLSCRAQILESTTSIADNENPEQKMQALCRTAISQFDQYAKLNSKVSADVVSKLATFDDPEKLVDLIASYLNIPIKEKQKLLEINEINVRFEEILQHIQGEIGVLQVEKNIRGRVKRQMEKSQREYYLNEQLKAIQKELTDSEDGQDDIADIEAKIKKVKLSDEAREKTQKELRKLKSMSPMSAEASIVRNYLDWMLDIPWKKRSRVKHDLNEATKMLDKEHFGLEKVKERIVEYLAVQERTKKIRGPILCLVGPPGVGKTSLGKSIADATGRKFVRMALGGVRDEAEIRGHRRTYIGSMPGKIIQGMKKAGSSNPLFLLDEIDKMASDWRGDPASALLEVLDPEQNHNFNDHYLEVDYDLSDVLFVCTANSMNMPRPLLDRMEIIHLSGYTEDEKVEITKRHLISKQIKENGLKKKEIEVTESAVRDLIRYYTREAGVRSLERELANVARKSVKKILTDNRTKSVKVTHKNLEDFAGVRRYRYGEAEEKNLVGVVTGLAWTQVGGDILSIEAVVLPGKGKMTLTGKLGDVMQESIQAAASFVRSKALDFGIKPVLFEEKDIHIHVPEGATPKDGPSAGIAMVTSIVSALTGIAIRKDVAMTGEVTLRGRVLPIGGLKEKLLAALRAGIKHVVIPKDNEKDLKEIPDNVKEGLKIHPVDHVDDVLKIALVKKLKPLKISKAELTKSAKKDTTDGVVTKH